MAPPRRRVTISELAASDDPIRMALEAAKAAGGSVDIVDGPPDTHTAKSILDVFRNEICRRGFKPPLLARCVEVAEQLNVLTRRRALERELAHDPVVAGIVAAHKSDKAYNRARALLQVLPDELAKWWKKSAALPEPYAAQVMKLAIEPIIRLENELKYFLTLKESGVPNQGNPLPVWQDDLPLLEALFTEAMHSTNAVQIFGTKGALNRFVVWSVKQVHDKNISEESADVALREARAGKQRQRRNSLGNNARA